MAMQLRTYPDPPTVMETEKRRLNRRKGMLLALFLMIALAIRSIRGATRG